MFPSPATYFFFFFNDTATTEIYTLSLHDALPISIRARHGGGKCRASFVLAATDQTLHRHHAKGGWCIEDVERSAVLCGFGTRSEEHTSELQSRPHLVCRLLLEKKKKIVIAKELET